jgi:hypothetical protein
MYIKRNYVIHFFSKKIIKPMIKLKKSHPYTSKHPPKNTKPPLSTYLRYTSDVQQQKQSKNKPRIL